MSNQASFAAMDECRARALPSSTSLLQQISTESVDSVMLDSADWGSGSPQPDAPGPPSTSQPLATSSPDASLLDYTLSPPPSPGAHTLPSGFIPPPTPSPSLPERAPTPPASPSASPPPSASPSGFTPPCQQPPTSLLDSLRAVPPTSPEAHPPLIPSPELEQAVTGSQGSKRALEDEEAVVSSVGVKRRRQNSKKNMSVGAKAIHVKTSSLGKKLKESEDIADQSDNAAPPWVKSASKMFHSEPMSPSWSETVVLWEKFEASHGFSGSGRITATHRPACISDWIQRAHSPSFRPNITNLEQFETKFLVWWAALQPEWRQQADGQLSRGTGDWAAI
jgi:hypothetical protein